MWVVGNLQAIRPVTCEWQKEEAGAAGHSKGNPNLRTPFSSLVSCIDFVYTQHPYTQPAYTHTSTYTLVMLRIWATTAATVANPLLSRAHCLPVGTGSKSALSPPDAHIMRLLLSLVIIIFGFYVITFQQGRSPAKPPNQSHGLCQFSCQTVTRSSDARPDMRNMIRIHWSCFWACCRCFCAVVLFFGQLK